MSDNKHTVESWLAEVGRQKFIKGTGRTDQMIWRAIQENYFPCAWFVDVRTWCLSYSLEVPEYLFKFDVRLEFQPPNIKHSAQKKDSGQQVRE